MCLSTLLIEDIENVYISGFMMAGFLLIGGGGYRSYIEIQNVSGAIRALMRLSAFSDGIFPQIH